MTLQRQREALLQKPSLLLDPTPWHHYDHADEVDEATAEGLKLLTRGAVGCIIVAGGHGSRLQYEAPKGTFPLTTICGKSLFRLFAEKTVAAGHRAGSSLPLAIMTAPDNYQVTRDYLKRYDAFGLTLDQELSLYIQEELPYLDENGEPLFDERGEMMMGPAGNGWSLRHFVESGLWQRWHDSGVAYVNFLMVDNPLADPFDPLLIGYHALHGGDVTLKSSLRHDAEEKVGILVDGGGRPLIAEYHTLSEGVKRALTPSGGLKFPLANLGMFCFSMAFIARCHQLGLWDVMPLHPVHKAMPRSGRGVWKFERYIFDLLPWSEGSRVLVYPRECCFAPFKEREGIAGVQAVQNAILERDRRIYSHITGVDVPAEAIFELSQEFYYPTEELVRRWRGRVLPPPNGYVQDL